MKKVKLTPRAAEALLKRIPSYYGALSEEISDLKDSDAVAAVKDAFAGFKKKAVKKIAGTGAALLRGKKRRKRADALKTAGKAALITLGAAALAAGVTYLAASALADIGTKRKAPLSDAASKHLLKKTFPDTKNLDAAFDAGAALKDAPHEVVSLTSFDGTVLTGHYFPRKDAKRILIAFHGWRSVWYNDFGLSADALSGLGCSVLYAEQRAHGASEGERIGLGAFEMRDVLEWVKYVCENTEGDLPVYLCGISMGATSVLLAAGLGLPGRVHGIIADCGFVSPRDVWDSVLESNLKPASFLLAPISGKILDRRLSGGAGLKTTDALARSLTPVLFVHGTDDALVPVSHTYENYAACRGEKRILIVPGAAHAGSFFTDPQGYEAAVRAFFSDFDR